MREGGNSRELTQKKKLVDRQGESWNVCVPAECRADAESEMRHPRKRLSPRHDSVRRAAELRVACQRRNEKSQLQNMAPLQPAFQKNTGATRVRYCMPVTVPVTAAREISRHAQQMRGLKVEDVAYPGSRCC